MGRFSTAITEIERSPSIISESMEQFPVLQALLNERTEPELESIPNPKCLSRLYALDDLRLSIYQGCPNRKDKVLCLDITEALSELLGGRLLAEDGRVDTAELPIPPPVLVFDRISARTQFCSS